MTVEIVYETHAITTDNEAGISTGWLAGRLSAQGRREALELGERRRCEDVAAVFTSDLHRSVETARLAFPDAPPLGRPAGPGDRAHSEQMGKNRFERSPSQAGPDATPAGSGPFRWSGTWSWTWKTRASTSIS